MTKMYPRDNNHNPVIVTGFGGKDGQRRELTMPARYAINAILVALFVFGRRGPYFSLSDRCF